MIIGQLILPPDTVANRVAAGIEGRMFFATDTLAWYRDNGTAWVALANAPIPTRLLIFNFHTSGTSSITANSWFKMSFTPSAYPNGESYDETNGAGANLWDTTQNAYKVPENGYYRIDAFAGSMVQTSGSPAVGDRFGMSVDTTAAAAGNRPVYGTWQGGQTSGSYQAETLTLTRVMYLTAGQYLYWNFYGSTAAVANIPAECRLSIMRVK